MVTIATYLPPWTRGRDRVAGPDEDAITMAVAAGRAADPDASADRVVFVSRDFPLLEGGNGAVVIAALSLPPDTPVAEVLGGAPAVLDQLSVAAPGTLVVAADADGAYGAAAVLTGPSGAPLAAVRRVTRSLPVTARGEDGVRHLYADPRLQREVGIKAAVHSLSLDGSVCAAAGLGVKDLDGLDVSAARVVQGSSAPALIRALAAAVEAQAAGLVLAVEQASVTAATLGTGSCAVVRDEQPGQELPKQVCADGVGIPISLAAYARAFEPKLRWEAAVFEEKPGIDTNPVFPPRVRVSTSGELAADFALEPLPRTGTVYTHTTIRIPVPDLPSPYSLAVVQLDGSPVRVLLKVTGVPAGQTEIGHAGVVVLRKIADRTGIPDYGYAFWPGRTVQGVNA